jgi:two-component system nitrate/nitrite response regulator NarL
MLSPGTPVEPPTSHAAPLAASATEMRILRVVIGDACAVTRYGLRLALEGDSCLVCGEAEHELDAVELARRERPDVCLLDARLPGDPLAAVAAIASDLPGTAVVIFGEAPDWPGLLPALEAGASGYLPRGVDPARLPVILRRAADGESILPRAVVSRLVAELRERQPHRRAVPGCGLTRREFEVLDLLREGLSTAQIAERLYVAQVTVRTHQASIRRKLGAAGGEELTSFS